MSSLPSLWNLFCRSFQLSATTIGGGFVILSAMERIYVNQLGWLTHEEMLDITAMAQSAPGAVAVNAALLAGTKVRGTAGAIASLVGCILPPFGIMCLLGMVYSKVRDSAAVAFLLPIVRILIGCMLAKIAVSLCRKNLTTRFSRILFTISLVGIVGFGADSILFLALAAVVAVVYYMWRKKKV